MPRNALSVSPRDERKFFSYRAESTVLAVEKGANPTKSTKSTNPSDKTRLDAEQETAAFDCCRRSECRCGVTERVGNAGVGGLGGLGGHGWTPDLAAVPLWGTSNTWKFASMSAFQAFTRHAKSGDCSFHFRSSAEPSKSGSSPLPHGGEFPFKLAIGILRMAIGFFFF